MDLKRKLVIIRASIFAQESELSLEGVPARTMRGRIWRQKVRYVAR